jgi:Leucine-rich repeat (LRR) protein
MRYGFITLMVVLLSGCANYAVTLNNKSIITPTVLYQTKKIIDNAFNECVEQTIIDQQIKDPQTLRTIDCGHAGIEKLDGIQQFAALSEVRFQNNNLTSLTPLFFLDELTLVDLHNNTNIDCADLRQLRGRDSIKALVDNICE